MKFLPKIVLLIALLLTTQASAANPVAFRGPYAVRSAAILTTSYVGTTAVDMLLSNELLCYVNFTLGSLTSAEIKVQYSSDSSAWYDEAILNTSVGITSADEFISPLRSAVYQLTATSTKAIAVPNLGRYMRLVIKGTGTVTSSSAAISCYAGTI